MVMYQVLFNIFPYIIYPHEYCNKQHVLFFSIKGEETKAHGGWVIGPKLCCSYIGELEFEPRQSDSRIYNCNHYVAKM